MSQAELAAVIGKSRAMICMIEGAGKHTSQPSPKTLQAIVDAFGVTMERFYGSVPKPKKTAA